jgi:primosomal protein N' (replication factor Y)
MPSRIGKALPPIGADNTGETGLVPAGSGNAARDAMRVKSGTPEGLPLVRRVDMNHQPRRAVFSLPLLDAIRERVARGEQCMVFLNRRGYAPVLHCADCGWKSECPHCSAFRVFHKIDRTLRCHHCGFTERVPRACPACGNVDIEPMGRGTEQLEEQLGELLADVRRPGTVSAEHPDGAPLRIARIDADSTRLKGTLETQLAAVHAGEVDVLVGTQMIAKGHDFRRITLVAAINPDGALFSSDFRAPERLFSLLMQAAGRAGRDAALGESSEVWIQTFQPAHPLYAALKAHDYPAFAEQQLQERAQAGMPPFSAQALVRAEARTQEAAQAFLSLARASALEDMAQWPGWAPILEQVFVYPAVPMSIQRIANVERAQMLVESPSRSALQKFLAAWHAVLHATRADPACKGLIRWAVDVDPLSI